MQVKKIFIFVLFLSFSSLWAQKIGSSYLPPKTTEMPAWFEVFYSQTDVTQLNVNQLDESCKAYEKIIRKRAKEEEAVEMLTGEENEDAYMLYYKRWRRAIQAYVQADGSIQLPIPEANVPSVQHFGGSPYNEEAKTHAANSTWSLLGPKTMYWKFSDNAAQPSCPWQTNVYACAMAPSNHAILFAAPETGGIFKTTDKGLNWSLALDQTGVGSSVIGTYSGDPFFALAVHPTNPDIVYAGRSSFICVSTDGGANWLSTSPACGTVNGFAIQPSDPNTVYAACSNGLYKTTNAGLNWTVVSGMTTACYDVYFKTDDDNIIFVLKKVGSVVEFWRSTNAGVSFASSSIGWTGKGTTSTSSGRMTVSPANANRIYAVVLSDDAASTQPYIFKTSDAGLTWDTVCTGNNSGLTGNTVLPLGMSNGQGYYDLDIMANPANAEELIVASTTAYKSTNGGLSFSRLGGYGGAFSIHPDIQEIISLGSDTWIATDGGMNYSSDFFTSTVNFSTRTTGIFGTEYWGFTQGWNENLTSGGRYHNGNDVMYETYPAGAAIRLGGGEAATGYYMIGRSRQVAFSDITSIAVPPTLNGLSTSFSFPQFPNEDLWRTDASEVEFLPYCYNHLFMGKDNDFWKSTNGGLSWVSLYTFSGKVRQIEISRSNPDVMYVSTALGFYKSINGGTAWNLLALPSGVSLNNLQITLSFSDENTLWIAGSSQPSNKRVYKTTDGGTTWINLTTATINAIPYYNIVTQAGTNGGVYILGKSGKVYYRNNSMPDWVSFSNQLPKGYLPLKTYPFYRDGKLRSAGNRGVWEVDFYEDSAPMAQPMVDKLTSNCPRDTFYFDDYSALRHAGATWSWTFSGASYVSSTSARNPKVLFSGIGTYDFALTVSNAMGSSSKTITGKISIIGNECGVDTIPGKMLTLSAAGDYAQQTQALNITTNNITISAWIKPNGTQMGNAGIIFSGNSGATGFNFRSTNQVGYHWADQASTYNWSGGPTLPANEWSHLAFVVKDGVGTSDTAIIYLNGVPYQRVGTHNPVTFSSVFQFGIDRSNTARNFVGSMDEVCFYNRALSKNEIRELMNLTRNNPNNGSMPALDASLIAYYQFNEGITSPVYDKVASRNLNLVGGANKTQTSTAPVGGGSFQRLAVTNGGLKNFSTPGIELTFPATGTYPNGDLVVTRLHVPSDQACGAQVLPNPAGYWIIRNYGTNATFSAATAMTFKNVLGTNGSMVASPSFQRLYKRASNQDGNTWTSPIDDADVVTNTGGKGNITFNTGLSLTSFSQFSMESIIPLPLHLLTFSANLTENHQGRLVWESTNEVNFYGYEVEYSKNGQLFEKLGFVEGKGSGEYEFYHTSLSNNKNYYRLKMIDLAGTYSYSEIKILQLPSIKSHQLYPNPNQDGWFNLDIMYAGANKANLSFSNSLGQIVYTFSIDEIQQQGGKFKFFLPVTEGVYFMKMTLDTGETVQEKLMID